MTQDEDLLAKAKRCQAEGIAFSGVVYAHQLHVTIGVSSYLCEILVEIIGNVVGMT